MLPDRRLLEIALQYSLSAYAPMETDGEGTTFGDWYNSATATLTELDDIFVIAFKGSAEIRDWLINFRAIPPYRHNGVWVHWGFKSALMSIWPTIMKEIAVRNTLHKPLLITGHSLGGAMAELACLDAKKMPVNTHMITFGKPNVFFRPKESRLRHLKTQLSVVLGSDLVARIPRILYGPDPGQKYLYLANTGTNYVFDWDTVMGDYKGAQLLKSDRRFCDRAADHSLIEYEKRLSTILSGQDGLRYDGSKFFLYT